MKKVVAIDTGLQSYKERLEKAGFRVIDLSEQYQFPSAVVVKNKSSVDELANPINEVPILESSSVSEATIVEVINSKIYH
ncbi:YkuS family protein [Proteinivorax tanatarense]|uniref:YkuS family protein n=1 Tax=Proteinivorax tanatarense TaxID=1260629 RepID=A0AAU7VLZ1_9FIRM